jgi:hypothetical protein
VRWTKNFKREGPQVIEIGLLSKYMSGGRVSSIKTADVPTEMRREDLPNASLYNCLQTKKLGVRFVV